MGAQSQALRFEGNRTAAAERVANWRRVFGKVFQHFLWLVALRRRIAAPSGDRAGDLKTRLA